MLLKRNATAGSCRQSVPAQLVQGRNVPVARRVQNPSRLDTMSPCKVAEATSAGVKDVSRCVVTSIAQFYNFRGNAKESAVSHAGKNTY